MKKKKSERALHYYYYVGPSSNVVVGMSHVNRYNPVDLPARAHERVPTSSAALRRTDGPTAHAKSENERARDPP